ncbi:hypothetical protein BDZ45DRAFT_808713 [Acephala macrosclerotiorum]|nr:hypothetical protein BDZ45DRAFT_808713 [Acephala macrosclerotiorum]
MSDSDENENAKKAGVPQWQLDSKTEASPNPDGESASESPSRATIIEQARKFLEEEEVRNTTTDKKIAFLEKKGLQQDEIRTLIGVTRNEEASSKPSETQDSKMSEAVLVQQSTPQYTTQSTPSSPPIITYPEFLTTPTSPSPLITKNRLLTTLYLFSGLSALLYGTHTYLITPMVASLTDSRLSLAGTSKTNLSKLISKLQSVVSEIPSEPIKHHEHEDGESSDDEDPTELFHRDIGIQTSPPRSRSSSPAADTSEFVLERQTSQLSKLKESLQGLVDDSTSEGHDVTELEGTIGVLREYLDGMAFVTPSYGYGGYGGSSGGNKEENDEISKVKASIRGVKGVLLSARSFPGGVRAGVGVR